MTDTFRENVGPETPQEHTEDTTFEAAEQNASPVVDTPTESAAETKKAEVPTLTDLGIETPDPQVKDAPEVVEVDKRAEIGTILQDGLREKLEKLPQGRKVEIVENGRALRDRLYDAMNQHLFDDTQLVEVVYEWLSKFELGDAYTLTEARNRAEKIRELYTG